MQTDSPRYNIAHRGARSLAPENTMSAFIKAWQVGAHGIETDISVTADGELILFHDNNFLRTTDIAKIYPHSKKEGIHNFTLQEIQRLDAGSWFIEKDPFGTLANKTISRDEAESFRGVTIPLLEELLHFVKNKSWFINIEIKPLPQEMSGFPVVEKVLECIEKIQLDPHFFSISSYHHPFLYAVNKLHPEVEINALIGEVITVPHQWGRYEFEIYNANVELIDALQIQKAKDHGCRVNLYTVNKLAEMKHYLSLGIEKIFTDFPQLLSPQS